MNALHYMRIIARALDYAKDPDPNHWKTINGSHVHLDKNGNYDGGAGSKFNGRHHYGKGWKAQAKKNQPSVALNNLAEALQTNSNSISEVDKITNQVKEMDKKQEELRNQAKKILSENYSVRMGWDGHEAQQAEYYELLHKANELNHRAGELQAKRGEMKAKTETPEKKTFVNGFGEATTRYVTTATYERQQKRLGKQIASFLGAKS